jgi:hypothetical protein
MAKRPSLDPDLFVSEGLIDRAVDYHLRNWARWMRICDVGKGYDHKSAVLTGYGADTFDEMVERQDKIDAKIANACIESLAMHHQCAIHNVYLADVWRFRGDPVDVFVEAAGLFWVIAHKRGLT